MNKNILKILGILFFSFGVIDVINIIDYPTLIINIGWTFTIIGILLIIASNFVQKKKPNQ
ncbi:hypothetical protein AAV35_000405 [Salimicrobium jeotgali]|uniref:Uncharacterized protein n=1 Tax=Salimicrobium jeotgali TaxID=1230341 RepID=A0AAC8T671_9BACI|nr:hypothetical protein [Salimicrobium jeotgali]AKG03393.1 hypothetical protein AAV35_000405 [Salimicrobium jeotgali]MBM7697688.1 hypothetical protein [Salimicrobium jeotgali]